MNLTNWKLNRRIVRAQILHFKTFAKYIDLEKFEKKFILYFCMKEIAFFGSTDEIKMHQSW